MTCRREWFTEYEELPANQVEVVLGNDHVLSVAGIGSVSIVLANGMSFLLQKVLHVPELRPNLFSLSVVAKRKCRVVLEDNGLQIFGGHNKSELLASGLLIDRGLYKMDFETNVTVHTNATSVVKETLIDVWHQRLGHVNYSTIQRMIGSNAVSGLENANPNNPSATCVPCTQGKMNRGSFPTSNSRANRCAELIHFDTVGPFQTPSLGNAQYICVFVDDYSGMTFVYPMKQKSEANDAIKWMVTTANKDNYQVVNFRSDNAKEYFSSNVNRYLLDCNTHHEASAPDCPEQNGRIERQNRTIGEMVRTLLHSANLPMSLWAELARTASYIRNMIPLERLNFKTPFEVWYGRKPDFKHLRIIGSRAFAYSK